MTSSKKTEQNLNIADDIFEMEKQKAINTAKSKCPGCTPESKESKGKKMSSDKAFFLVLSIIIITFGLLIFGYSLFVDDSGPKTIHELHQANLQGELDEMEGYIYNGFSFIKYNDQWWTEFARAGTTQTYDANFRYGPKEVEDIPLIGDYYYITNFPNPYLTFDPTVEDIHYDALAAADVAMALNRAFGVIVEAACTINESDACANRKIIECEPGVPVIYLKRDNQTYVEMVETCMIIHGTGFEMVKAVDRLLFGLYGIMG